MSDAAKLIAQLKAELASLSEAKDPFSNPVLMLAHDLSRRIAAGELTYETLGESLHLLTVQAFLTRSRRLTRYLGETDPRRNIDTLRRLARRLAADGEGATVPFEEYKARVEREIFGAVLTGHPTFNLSADLMHALVDLATGRDENGAPLDDDAREERIELARTREHRPEPMTLEREHELSQDAIVNLHGALRRLYASILEVAEELYPMEWRQLTPRLVTVASWVGYDLDGRSDIGWTDTLHMHLRGHASRLKLTLAEVASIRSAALSHEPAGQALAAALDRISARLSGAIHEVQDEIAAFGRSEAEPHEVRARIGKISRRIIEGLPQRLTDSGKLIAVLQEAIDVSRSSALARRLIVLRAELANTGLGLSHVHVRINASQLHNSIRQAVGMETDPDDPRYRATYVSRIDDMLGKVQTASINFGSMLIERASARRLFMVVAQMLKFVDSNTPIRFLIAECETAFTVLTALYYARLFGVENRVDISPLFETEKALENGHRIIAQLLSFPAYRAYVQKRGRLCVQTGYSDAGRYLGQMAAGAAIERLKLRLARVLKENGMTGVELVLFDTHGESVGRGAHPTNLTEALAYADTPASREAWRRNGIPVKEEVSFQGGDGYLYFMNQSSALAALTRIMEHAVEPPPAAAADPFYAEGETLRELFTAITTFQVDLMADPDFGALLGAFATNFLYPSGSRNMVRQREDAEPKAVAYAAELRAIPQNAALQQLGVLANSWGGLGAAITRDPKRFAELYHASPRLRSLMGIAEYALTVGSFDAVRAYIETQNPNLWLLRAGATDDRRWAERLRSVARLLERANLHEAQDRIVRKLYADHLLATEGITEITNGVGGNRGAEALVESDTRSALLILHAFRVALILELYELATRVPDFGPQMGTTRERTLLRLLHLDVTGAVNSLERIFSLQPSAAVEDFGEEATYRGDDSHTYETEHEQVFRPLRERFELVRRVSSAIVHHIGFLG